MNNPLFSLNTSSGVPIYRQLTDQIKQAIRLNLLERGEQLPSVRHLAKQLEINPMTISKAYAQLEYDAVLIRKRGVGMLVATTEPQIDLSATTQQALKAYIDAAHQQGLSNEQIIALTQQYLSLEQTQRGPQSWIPPY